MWKFSKEMKNRKPNLNFSESNEEINRAYIASQIFLMVIKLYDSINQLEIFLSEASPVA